MAANPFQRYELIATDNTTKATIVPERGGFISSLILPFPAGAQETLFLHDFAWEKHMDDLVGGIPFLFPICGRLSRNGMLEHYLYNNKLYQLKIHGFSWYQTWTLEKHEKDSIELTLQANEATQARYPFQFEVRLQYHVSVGKLTCHASIANHEKNKSMPYYAGFHPYFATPKLGAGKEKVTLNFSSTQHLTYNHDLTDIIGEEALIRTPISITDPNINEQLNRLGKDKRIQLNFDNGDILNMVTRGDTDPDLFPYLQLYSPPKAPFFCMEPWMSFPNALNTACGARQLAPNETETGILEIFV